MTQLYVGNLSAEGDEKAVRALFGKYGNVREVLMKNGYAFVEFDNPISADEAMRDLNGSDIIGHPMIVEPSHQQRLSNRYMRKGQFGKVEVTDIPPHLSIQNIESLLSQVGQVLKMEIEEEFGMRKIVVTYETQEQAQNAATVFHDISDHAPRVVYVDVNGGGGLRSVASRKGSPGIPSSPSKNSDFPLRILVPSDMVGAIIGKDGATIRMITQITKARVDVHRRENLGTAEKIGGPFMAITIIGPPECCTEACYQIMKIMQNELLMNNGMLENGKFHETLPVVPLKILAHNELVGRVIGKGGNTLKRIMAESGTKITISKLKDLTAYNMERTITILGNIDNCKKAESLISAKLRASYESDMAQFIPEQSQVYSQHTLSPSPTNISPPAVSLPSDLARLQHAQSLPATPTNPTSVRTFTDFSAEHTRLTTLHGSTGALEVNNLGGFKLGPITQNGSNGIANGIANGTSKYHHPSAFESTIDGLVKTNGHSLSNGHDLPHPIQFPKTMSAHHQMNPGVVSAGVSNPAVNSDFDDEISDVFSGLSMSAAPGFGRYRPRRSSAPVGAQNHGYNSSGGAVPPAWGNSDHSPEPPPPPPPSSSNGIDLGMFVTQSNGFSTAAGASIPVPTCGGPYTNHNGQQQQQQQQHPQQQNGGFNGWGSTINSQAFTNGTQSIWSGSSSSSNGGGGGGAGPNFQGGGGGGGGGGGSRPNSQTSSYSTSEQSSLSGFSPIYSPTSSGGFGFSVSAEVTTTPNGLLTTNNPLSLPDDVRPSFKASIPTTLTTVAETVPISNGGYLNDDADFMHVTSATLDLLEPI